MKFECLRQFAGQNTGTCVVLLRLPVVTHPVEQKGLKADGWTKKVTLKLVATQVGQFVALLQGLNELSHHADTLLLAQEADGTDDV